MKKSNTRTTETFEILNVCPASNVEAVYAIESESQEGRFRLECEAIHFLGTVSVTEKTFLIGEKRDSLLRELKLENRVVGLSLNDGYLSPCDEVSNFLGLIYRHESPTSLYIPSEYPLEVKG